MKKIAFLINSLGKGGAERVVTNLAEHFHKNNYDVLIVTSRELDEEYEIHFPVKRRLLEDEISARMQQGSLRIISRLSLAERLLRMPQRIKTLKKIWEEEKPDIVVGFIGKMNLYAMMSTKGLSIPVILSVRSDPAKEYPSLITKALAERLFRKAAGVVFQTEDAKQAFSKKVQERSVVLPNALDDSFVKERYEGVRKDEIVMVGRLDANKNHAMVLKAFAQIKQQYPNMRVVIYGGGLEGSDTRPMLEKLAKELEIEKQVCFMGRQTGIRERIEKSRIFVLASNYEGMPNALLEAMATGLCVIATDCPCGGPKTVIRNGENGILIPVGGEKELVAAFKQVLENPELEEKLGREAAKIVQELAPEKVCKSWQEEIEGRAKKYVSCKS